MDVSVEKGIERGADGNEDRNRSVADLRSRVHLLDMIRGILIIYVVYYHFMYDLNDIMGYEIPYLYSEWFSAIRDCMSGSLIFISGISCNFSRNNIKRGARTVFIALMLSVMTVIVMPSQTIIFGILHLLGMMMVLYGFAEYVFKKQDAGFKTGRMYVQLGLMAVFFILFFVCRNVYYGWLELGIVRVALPKTLYGGKNTILYIMGFGQKLYSADYYPLLPWGYLFLAGAMGGYVFRAEGLPGLLYRNSCRPLAFVGRHTMLIYLVHQPLLLGGFMLLSGFLGP